MNNKKFLIGFAFAGLLLAGLTGCNGNNESTSEGPSHLETTEQGNPIVVPDREISNKLPQGEFNNKCIFVKSNHGVEPSDLQGIDYKDFYPIYEGSDWYQVNLNKEDDNYTQSVVSNLSFSHKFIDVDYDYVMTSTSLPSQIIDNPYAVEQTNYLDGMGINEGWQKQIDAGKEIGGNKSTVIAVIDTGVDYHHPDLMNNIWHNPGEIANNNKDDDGNGYVDDVYGYDFVNKDKKPIDDNGHGTHVAGIIAAENNAIGTVGVAFNTKIMCLKAGNGRGLFSSSNVTEAIKYAYMNGATVINMSFGGYTISKPEVEALKEASKQSILVAAAGNDHFCNNNRHAFKHSPSLSTPMFPASLHYVIGVMASDSLGTRLAPFSNYDDTLNDKYEYEIAAAGENIISTWPNGKYARLSGTSMAAPLVSGVAALLRDHYTDRQQYPNSFITSLLMNTATGKFVSDHNVLNYSKYLKTIPSPNVSLVDSYILDSIPFASGNNGDNVYAAGETLHIGIDSFNRGGVAENVNVTLTNIDGATGEVDPYIQIKNGNVNINNIGTALTRDFGPIYDEWNTLSDFNKYFEVTLTPDCPNEHEFNLKVNYSYKNGLNPDDTNTYVSTGYLYFKSYAGVKMPSVVTSDITYTSNQLVIVNEDVLIAKGKTVTFGEGCKILIQWSDNYRTLSFNNFGNVYFNGTLKNEIRFDYDKYSHGPVSFKLQMDSSDLSKSSVAVFKNVTFAIGIFFDMFYGENNAWTEEYYLNSITMENCVFESESRAINAKNSIFYQGADLVFCNDSIVHRSCSLRNCKNIIVINDYSDESTIFSHNDNVLIMDNCSKNSYIGKIELIENTRLQVTGKIYQNAGKIIKNFYDEYGNPRYDFDSNPVDKSLLPAYVEDVKIFNSKGEITKTLGAEVAKVQFKYSKPMNTSINPSYFYGIDEDYGKVTKLGEIKGNWLNDTTWEGNTEVLVNTQNGNLNILDGNPAYEANEIKIPSVKMFWRFGFTVDTVSAMAMTLKATANDNGTVTLDWVQDDYETLMGYNIYRSENKDGNYVRINPSIIPENEHTFIDDNAEPGKSYWYTFTVVLTDMSESAPAGKVACTVADVILPNIYHTPINQGYLNNNIVISCTASDNIGIVSVTLYYRIKGESTWNTLEMTKNNDKYSATIYGNELDKAGMEYYIEAKDTLNTISKGSKDNPYQIAILDASSIAIKGDVDGDGLITTKDALMMVQAMEDKIILTDDQFKRADLNNSGIIESAEVLRLLQYINGKVPDLNM